MANRVIVSPHITRKIARDIAQSMEMVASQPEGSRHRVLHSGRMSGIRMALYQIFGAEYENEVLDLAEAMKEGRET